MLKHRFSPDVQAGDENEAATGSRPGAAALPAMLAVSNGTNGNDTLVGGAADDTLTGGAGNDALIGAGGSDVSVFAGSSGTYRFSVSYGTLTIEDRDSTADGDDGTDTVQSIEVLRFKDRDFTLASGEFRVNTTWLDDQSEPAVATLANGAGFVVAWTSYGQDGSDYGVYAQRFNGSGAAVGVEFKVNTYTTSYQWHPAVAALANGSFVVVWESWGQDGSGYGIYAQMFSATGAAQGSEFAVNTINTYYQEAPAVAALAGGGFVVSWESDSDIYARRYGAAGAAQDASEFRVNNYVTGTQQESVVTALAGGGFVVAWSSYGQDGTDYGVYAQRYKADGSKAGNEFRVNTYTASSQADPALAALAGGGFVVVWESYTQDGAGYGIYGQRYDSAGVAQGGEFLVNTTVYGSQDSPAVSAIAGGGFVVSWSGYKNDVYGIIGQRYDASGAPVGGEFRLNGDYVYGDAALAPLGEGFVAAWQNYDTSGGGVLANRFDADGVAAQWSIAGTAGNDRIDISGYYGDVRAAGGAGNDTYVVDSKGDIVTEAAGQGTDTVESAVNWTLPANVENLTLTGYSYYGTAATGNALANVLTGDYYNEVFAGLGGNDTLNGGSGIDLASYATSPSAVTVDFSLVQPLATGGDGTDTLIDMEGAIGSAFGDTLTGGAGANSFQGGGGADLFSGGAGNDTLEGGSGNDRVVFSGNFTGYRFGWQANGYLQVEDVVPAGGNDGIDLVRNIETLQFLDRNLGSLDGGEVRVNTTTEQEQGQPAIATLANGAGYVITWQSWLQDGDDYGVYAQRFAADGSALGAEFQVNTETYNYQWEPQVAALAGGGFVIVWSSWVQDGDSYGVYAQRYNSAGVAQGEEFRVNTTTAYEQSQPAIVALDGGGFVIAWQSWYQIGDSDGLGVFAQRFNAVGAAQGGEFQLNTTATDYQDNVTLAARAGGGFVAAWESQRQDGDGEGVYAQLFGPAGAKVGAEFRVNTTTAGDQKAPQLATLADGSFVAAWIAHDAVTGIERVAARRFGADGSALSGEFFVDSLTGNAPYDPAVTPLADGGFAVAWSTYLYPTYGVLVQRFDAAGARVGEEFLASTSYTYTSSAAPALALLDDGDFVATWQAYLDGSSYGIYAQRIGADGVKQMVELRGSPGDDRLDIGGAGDLQAVGGAGNDTYVVNGAGDRLVEKPGEGTDTVEALGSVTLGPNLENLRLLQNAYISSGTGNSGANQLTGNIYDNVLSGLGGDDTLDGGAGADTASYADATAGIFVSLLLTGPQDLGSSGIDTLLNIENLVGSAFADQLTGNAGNNVLSGEAGNDTLAGGAGNDTLEGGGGTDRVDYAGSFGDYRFGWDNGRLTIADANTGNGDDGTDALRNVETIQFTDREFGSLVGGETRVNTTTEGYQSEPSMAALAGGGYVLVWSSGSGTTADVFAQRYNDAGVAVGTEFRVNTTTYEEQSAPEVAALTGGGFVVTWKSDVGDGSDSGVFAQRFNAFGVAQGDEFRVNTYTQYSQWEPTIVGLSGGGFAIAWTSYAQDTYGYGVYVQRYNANGVAQGAEVLVNTTTSSTQDEPVLAATASGGFVVAWTSYGQDTTDSNGVYLQRFDGAGAKIGAETLANTTTAGDQSAPALAVLEGGNIVVAWRSAVQSTYEVHAQRFTAAGVKAGGEMLVGGDAPYNAPPELIALAGGDFLVAWTTNNEDGSSYSVLARRYDSGGTARGAAVRVNTTTSSEQSFPTAAALAGGAFAVGWQSWYQDGDGYGVYLQRFDAAGTAERIELTGTAGADRLDLSGAGDLQARGGAGDDTYVVDSLGDRLIEGATGGEDTLETRVSWTLGPVAQNIENLLLAGTQAINATGNDGPNVLTGNDQANQLTGGLGDDLLYGRGGTDIAVFAGKPSDFLVKQSPGLIAVTDVNTADGNLGTDVLVGVETLRFVGADSSVVDISLIGEFAVNATTLGAQTAPVLARQSGGGFVAVWQGQDAAGSGIFLQRYESAGFLGNQLTMGARVGAETRVNTATADEQANPAVITLTNGDIVVAWESSAQDGALRGVYAQRYDAAGVPKGAEFRVNTTTDSEQKSPALAALSTGGFVVAWESNLQDGSSYGIVARGYGADGVATSGEFVVNTATANAQLAPAVSALGSGAFVVAWESASGDSDGYGIIARRFASVADTSGTEIKVNTTTAGDQKAPAIATLSNGSFVIVWQAPDAGGQGIYAQRFNADGSKNGSQFAVNTTTTADQLDPEVAALTYGGFVVTWSSSGQDGSLNSVHAQRYDSNGTAQGSEFRVNTTTVNGQLAPAISPLDGGNFVIAWQSNGQDDSGYGIYAKGYSGSGTPIVPPIIGTDGDDVLDLTIGDVAAYGLKGQDTYIVDSSGDVVIEKPGEGTDIVQTSISWSLGANVENLAMVGGSNIGGTGNEVANTMLGNSGANTLRGNDGSDSLDGGAGNDRIFGGAEGNAASDASGNDTLDGGIGADTMEGGLGNDTYYVDDVNDLVQGEQVAALGGASAALLPSGSWPWPDAGAGANIDKVISQIGYTLRSNIENLELADGAGDLSGTGNELDNLLKGNGGHNALAGLAGADILDGGAGDDTLDGGTGNDTMGGGLDDDVYILSGNDTLIEAAGEGTDTVQVATNWTLAANFERLEFTGTANLNGTGNGADNELVGNSGANSLAGGAGDDTLDGGAGADTLAGGTGNDTYRVERQTDVVNEAASAGTDTVISTVALTIPDNVEVLQLDGSAAVNLTGNAGANRLVGNDGANVLDGRAGADTLSGGAGNDTYIVDGLDQVIDEGGDGADAIEASVSVTLAAEIEILRLTGASAIKGTGNGLDNRLTGNAAANTLDGGAGMDTLAGGAGNDTYLVGEGDTVTEAAGAGTDTVQSALDWTLSANIETLVLVGTAARGTGNTGANMLTGNDAPNILDGGAGNDTLKGGAANDTLVGGAGDDTFMVTAGDVITELAGEGKDTVKAAGAWTLGVNLETLVLLGSGGAAGTGNTAANTLSGNTGANKLTGLGGNDTLNGAAGNDTLTGGEGADLLSGSTGNDRLDGGAAADVLKGGAGNDTLIGGTGADGFVFDFALSATLNVDTLSDFTTGSDKLRLDKDVFQAFSAGVAVTAEQFLAAAGAVAATTAEQRLIYDTDSGRLYYDADGNAAGSSALLFAVLGAGATHPAIGVADFTIVA